ncbi:Protein Dr1 [Thelohanellus kitauei]|uniref:Protein Dr1 n=1 Tax=Thelohanellus kitauei TaxID=669202 RepID=A0A0C2MSN9_THEKT|nr:Protein Dr1 [Thelohanellus kitauei]
MKENSASRRKSLSVGRKCDSSEKRLPKSVIVKALRGGLGGAKLESDTRELIYTICEEFVKHLVSITLEQSDKVNKKVLAPEHVFAALKEMGYDQHIMKLTEFTQDYNQKMSDRKKKIKLLRDGFKNSGTRQSLVNEQADLIQAAEERRKERQRQIDIENEKKLEEYKNLTKDAASYSPEPDHDMFD